MKKVSRGAVRVEKPEITIGVDLGDRFSHYCMLNEDGDAIESGRIQTTEEALRRHFEGEPTMRFALECGTHSPLDDVSYQLFDFAARFLPRRIHANCRGSGQRVSSTPRSSQSANSNSAMNPTGKITIFA